MQRLLLILLFCVWMMVFFLACNKNAVDSKPSEKLPEDTVQIVPLTEILQFERGDKLYLHLNRQGFDIQRLSVIFDGLYLSGSERLLLCHTEDGSPIGAGDSGSPLKTADNRTVGALCFGYYGNSTQFEARVIEDMLTNVNTSQADLGSSPPASKRTFPLFFAVGIRRELMERLATTDMGRYQPDIALVQFDEAKVKLSKQPHSSATVRGGSTIAIFDIMGGQIQYGAYGTATFLRHDTLFAFGHRYSIRSTPIAGPVYLAEMISFVQSNTESFKAVTPTDQWLGSFVYQDNFGIRIDRSRQSQTFPVMVTVSLDSLNPIVYRHEIANAYSVSLEKYYAGATAGSLAWNYIRGLYYYEKFKALMTTKVRTEVQEYVVIGEAEDVAYWIDYAVMNYVFGDLFKEIPEAHLQSIEISIHLTRV